MWLLYLATQGASVVLALYTCSLITNMAVGVRSTAVGEVGTIRATEYPGTQ